MPEAAQPDLGMISIFISSASGARSLLQGSFHLHLRQRPPHHHQGHQPEPEQRPERLEHQRPRLHEEHRPPAGVPQQQRAKPSQEALHGRAR